MDTASTVRSKHLRRRSTPLEYRVYRAGLEWDLAEPAVIAGPDMLLSTRRWQDRQTPQPHQVANLLAFSRNLPATLLADETGLGRRAGAGLIAAELIARSRVSRVLVICSRALAPYWKTELANSFGIRSVIASGRELTETDPGEGGALITTYGSAKLFLDDVPADRFQMVVLDEVHRLRGLHGLERPPLAATRLAKALEDRRFAHVLMLTPTPIQDRLWDVYSLIDLLAIARGHDNPFGSEADFARRFIADGRDTARELRPDARETFREVVRGAMVRTRRRDAALHLPERIVQIHRVDPAAAERDLIMAMIKPVRKLDRPAQVAVLQALTSGPAAFLARLAAATEAAPLSPDVTERVKGAAAAVAAGAKLRALAGLIERLAREDPDGWRVAVFTEHPETAKVIRTFLEGRGLTVGAHFGRQPPEVRIVVSSGPGDADLSAATMLVNYDLPWNPMAAEERIGRVIRLSPDRSRVAIVNMVLKGTFEDTVVARLIGKLQAAARTAGDIEALLQGSDTADGDEDRSARFGEAMLDLVHSALSGIDVDSETLQLEHAIELARVEVARQDEAVSTLFGSSDRAPPRELRPPALPASVHAMAPREFVLAALARCGTRVTPKSAQLYLTEAEAGRGYIRFEEDAPAGADSVFHAPGSAAFRQLVARVIETGIHAVDDLDDDPVGRAEEVARRWVEGFGATVVDIEVLSARRSFAGIALMRVTATVTHDSYERLVEIRCTHDTHRSEADPSNLAPLAESIDDPAILGIDLDRVARAALDDHPVGEFCRFYQERRDRETRLVGDEARRARIEQAFTPRVETMLVGLEGEVCRTVEARVRYSFDGERVHEDRLVLVPHNGEVTEAPELGLCSQSDLIVPGPCLARCDISAATALRHLLVESEVSGRLALPDFSARCSLSGKLVLTDEMEISAVTGKPMASTLMKTSALSGKRGEPEHFGRCAFTDADVLNEELALSDLSGKPYRIDEQMRSSLSGRTGHAQEFVLCHETRHTIAVEEAEKCELTGYAVQPGILEACAVTGQRVLPTEVEGCTVTGQRVLKRLLVTSSVSRTRLKKDLAVRSSQGNYCAPSEARPCLWSGRTCHPEDLRTCALTGLEIHFDLATEDGPPRLIPMVEMLDGSLSDGSESHLWKSAADRIEGELHGGRCQVHAAILSPARKYLAVCSEVRTMLGIRAHQVGAVYCIAEDAVVGRLAVGKRGRDGWVESAP